ncbi:hypothetical protein PYW07_012902 [Mythimna separata]|uniref:ZAD domain-containing protein n=1 Tax=Mythimna separata TaxID=271217 RepID=A0AAD7Y9F7_MYTSE|nr:hypothetical protein PYW07_012902 [Mythimna separata]
MEKLSMCRICLAENVRMYIVVDKDLHELYEMLTDIPFVTGDRRPMLACFFCFVKLKQCFQLQRKCLEAEELFAQMMNKPNSLVDRGHLDYSRGLTVTPVENISIVDVSHIESIAVKEELPAVCERLDDVIEPAEEHQSDDVKRKKVYIRFSDVEDTPALYCSGSNSQVDVPLMEVKTEVEEEQEVPRKKRRASDTTLCPDSCERPRSPRPSLHASDAWTALCYGSESDCSGSDDESGFEVPNHSFIRTAGLSALLTPEDTEVDQHLIAATSDDATSGNSNPPPRATTQPRSLYDFDWRPFTKTLIPPVSRRESFSDINVGPTIPSVDPYEIFINIWDRQFMEYIASETNRYAQQKAASMLDGHRHSLGPSSRINHWKDTTADELYVYFALIIGMGIVGKSRIEEYWSTDADLFQTPGFSTYMSYSRFLILQKCLHFANSEAMCGLQLSDSEAKIFKIQPVLSHLNNRFQSLYRLSRSIVLDESLVLWKGRLHANQSIPNKVAALGIRSYEICEPQTGYLWRFAVHAQKGRGSRPQRLEDPLKASTSAIVLELIRGLEGKGHTLWMDNFYNSPCLARHLKSVGMDCVGTLRTIRKYVPGVLYSLTADDMADGQITGLTSGDVDILVWKHQELHALISTYHGNGVTRVHGVPELILVHDYNIVMGGADRKDQLLSMFPIERKRTKIWYKKLFRRLLNVSILNSYIIHSQTSSSSSSLSHREFRKSLVKSLLSRHYSRSVQPTAVNLLQPTNSYHRLVEYPFTGKQRKRRYCVQCRKLVRTYCQACNKTVCMDPCFLTLHT